MFITKKKFEAIINQKVAETEDKLWKEHAEGDRRRRQREEFWELQNRIRKIENRLDKLDGGIKDPGEEKLPCRHADYSAECDFEPVPVEE